MDQAAATAGASLMKPAVDRAVPSRTTRVGPRIEGVEVSAYEVPTDEPESDGTLEWDSTTIVVVEAFNGHERGIGYTYGDRSVAELIESKLAGVVTGMDALSPPAAWTAMRAELRNAGQQGPGAMALSAMDIALWDLKARLLKLPLAHALPRFNESTPAYGSGGFTSYGERRLREQARGWVEAGMRSVKVKVGRDPESDPWRLNVVRAEIGPNIDLMVDANGAYPDLSMALEQAERFRELGVVWLEEPLSNDNLEGLRELRAARPAGMAIAGGEYIWSLFDAERLLSAGAVDVLQADLTRCGGITELLRIDGICRAHGAPFSAHCAPAISAHACCAAESLMHLEYFHDHVRLESMLFEGTLDPNGGRLVPDPGRPGLGLGLRERAGEYRVR